MKPAARHSLAVLTLATALLLTSCADGESAQPVPLMALHAQPKDFDGETVITEGVVRRFED
ncbi:MAG: hypothetical protein ACLFSK_09705, partial [Ectothiorhodospira sp.]